MDIKQRYMLVGTSHVAKESKERILSAFNSFRPDVIGIELDRQRLSGLMGKVKGKLGLSAIGKIGITGYIFASIGRIMQKKIGNLAGMNPGEEMLLGANLARNNKLILALIDQDVSITLKNMSRKVRFSEKMRIVLDVILSPFSKKQKMRIDVSKVPDESLVMMLISKMKERYPGFYKVLLDDRNRHMARQIFMILKNNPEKRMLAIVGAGHSEGINKYIDDLIASNLTQ